MDVAGAGVDVDAIADGCGSSDTVSLAGMVGADVGDCLGDDVASGTTVVGDGVLLTTAVFSAIDPVEVGAAVTAASSSADGVGVEDVVWANPVSSATDPAEEGTAVTAASPSADGVGVGDVVWPNPVFSTARDDVGGNVWTDISIDDGSSEIAANSKSSAPTSK